MHFSPPVCVSSRNTDFHSNAEYNGMDLSNPEANRGNLIGEADQSHLCEYQAQAQGRCTVQGGLGHSSGGPGLLGLRAPDLNQFTVYSATGRRDGEAYRAEAAAPHAAGIQAYRIGVVCLAGDRGPVTKQYSIVSGLAFGVAEPG